MFYIYSYLTKQTRATHHHVTIVKQRQKKKTEMGFLGQANMKCHHQLSNRLRSQVLAVISLCSHPIANCAQQRKRKQERKQWGLIT